MTFLGLVDYLITGRIRDHVRPGVVLYSVALFEGENKTAEAGGVSE